MSRLDFFPVGVSGAKGTLSFLSWEALPQHYPPLNSLGCTGHDGAFGEARRRDAAGTCMRAMLRRNLAERRAGGGAGGSALQQEPQHRALKEGCWGTCSCWQMGLQGEAKQRSLREGNGSLPLTVR